jgi:hypothetical protein
MHRIKKYLFNSFIMILGLVVGFSIVELAVRILSPQEVGPIRFAFNPELGEIPVPYQKGVRHSPGIYTFAYNNNSLGMRGSREYQEKKETEYRILIMGDSFTYGFGVNDDQTFSRQVEKDLRANHLSIEVINAGNPGKGTDYALKLFETIGRRLHPDLTILCFFPNDFQDNERGEYYLVGKHGALTVKSLKDDQSRIKNLLFHLPGYNWLISWSQAANLAKQAGVDFIVNRAQKTGPDASAGLVVSYKKGLEGFSHRTNKGLTNLYVERLNAAVKHAGGELMMCYIPISQEVLDYRRTRTFSADERAIQHIAADNGMMLWSLTPLLAHSGQPIERLYYQEGHWTAAAHEIAAHSLSRFIQSGLGRRRQVMNKSRE